MRWLASAIQSTDIREKRADLLTAKRHLERAIKETEVRT
ncbi:hypothetical protein ABI_13440 [Asticcacaulis biprosthecium C19]|uniref:Uncharacterized protein n=1 Tax=Asticcacaulis biprosthecium C19 TaxID=715226 RepID=F4QI39_9CAUL|nr:hypothetical protein ABI_13440 [Asticcacaulis biprosthecium C19]